MLIVRGVDRVAHTNPVTGVGLDADHIEFVAMSLGFLLQATSLTVRRTLKLERVVESKASATGKVIGFSSGVALGALLCAGSLVCPLPVVAGVVAPWALGGAATGTLAGASAAIGSVVGVVKSGIQLDKTIKCKYIPFRVRYHNILTKTSRGTRESEHVQSGCHCTLYHRLPMFLVQHPDQSESAEHW